MTLLLVWVVEQWLKKVWPSGRKLTITEDKIRAIDSVHEEKTLELSSDLTYLSWFFRLSEYARGGHERRVPKSWLCLAGQLQQGDERLVVYTYVPVKKAESLIEIGNTNHEFHQIFPGEVYDTSFRSRIGPPTRPAIPASILAGRDGRYWLAERRRWSEGFELSPEDFETFIRFFQDHRFAEEEPVS